MGVQRTQGARLQGSRWPHNQSHSLAGGDQAAPGSHPCEVVSPGGGASVPGGVLWAPGAQRERAKDQKCPRGWASWGMPGSSEAYQLRGGAMTPPPRLTACLQMTEVSSPGGQGCWGGRALCPTETPPWTPPPPATSRAELGSPAALRAQKQAGWRDLAWGLARCLLSGGGTWPEEGLPARRGGGCPWEGGRAGVLPGVPAARRRGGPEMPSSKGFTCTGAEERQPGEGRGSPCGQQLLPEAPLGGRGCPGSLAPCPPALPPSLSQVSPL